VVKTVHAIPGQTGSRRGQAAIFRVLGDIKSISGRVQRRPDNGMIDDVLDFFTQDVNAGFYFPDVLDVFRTGLPFSFPWSFEKYLPAIICANLRPDSFNPKRNLLFFRFCRGKKGGH
jgi:hypothetical protein